MVIALPLALFGLGFMVYLMFAAAAYALPLLAGLSAGFAASHAGASGITALAIGIAAFLAVIALGSALNVALPRPARIGLILLFALPAAAATGSVALSLGRMAGIDEWAVIVAAIVAAVIGAGAGIRTIDRPTV